MRLRPVQIRIEEDMWRVLKVYAAAKGTTANEVIADMARRKAEEVKAQVAPLLRS